MFLEAKSFLEKWGAGSPNSVVLYNRDLLAFLSVELGVGCGRQYFKH